MVWYVMSMVWYGMKFLMSFFVFVTYIRPLLTSLLFFSWGDGGGAFSRSTSGFLLCGIYLVYTKMNTDKCAQTHKNIKKNHTVCTAAVVRC